MSKINKIIVNCKGSEGELRLLKDNKEILKTNAIIGMQGSTLDKKEGDLKTPIGIFKLGIAFGIKDLYDINVKYKKIIDEDYWVDDSKSKYYNKLINIKNVIKDWDSAEHLIEYPIAYEYAIEIKYNEECIPKKGSAIFLHCKTQNSTAGCIAINRNIMLQVLKSIDQNTLIEIIN